MTIFKLSNLPTCHPVKMKTFWLRIAIALLFITVMFSAKAEFGQWCVADGQIPDNVIQAAVDWACQTGGADYSTIQPNQPCFLPNTVKDHASVVTIALLFITVTFSAKAEFGQWCVADGQIPDNVIQAAVDWACQTGGADCSTIQPNQPCFLPNTVKDHASVVFNSYYQRYKHNSGTCDFNSTAFITQTDPSYGSCHFEYVQ